MMLKNTPAASTPTGRRPTSSRTRTVRAVEVRSFGLLICADYAERMPVAQPRRGVHFPRSLGELESWFASEDDCLEYLEWFHWPDGFVCPRRA